MRHFLLITFAVLLGAAALWWIAGRTRKAPFVELKGHAEAVHSAVFSSDGKKVVTGSCDKTARIWDAESGKELKRLEGHKERVYSPAFSPDSKKVVTGSRDGTARIWEAETGKELAVLEGHTEDVIADFSSDGKKVITGSPDKTVRIWDTEPSSINFGREWKQLEEHKLPVIFVAFSPDGKKMVSCDVINARIWDAESGEKLLELERPSGGVLTAAFFDGAKVVTGSLNGTIRIWDAESGKELEMWKKYEKPVVDVAFSPDGTKVVSCSRYAHAEVWDAESGKEMIRLFHSSVVGSVAFSPDSTKVVTGCDDGTARIWNLDVVDVSATRENLKWASYFLIGLILIYFVSFVFNFFNKGTKDASETLNK